MKLGRMAVGLAIRTAREAAGMTLADLSGVTGITASSLSRTENGLRAAEFSDVVSVADATHLPVEALLSLAETFEREQVDQRVAKKNSIDADLNRLQRIAIQRAVAAGAKAVRQV